MKRKKMGIEINKEIREIITNPGDNLKPEETERLVGKILRLFRLTWHNPYYSGIDVLTRAAGAVFSSLYPKTGEKVNLVITYLIGHEVETFKEVLPAWNIDPGTDPSVDELSYMKVLRTDLDKINPEELRDKALQFLGLSSTP